MRIDKAKKEKLLVSSLCGVVYWLYEELLAGLQLTMQRESVFQLLRKGNWEKIDGGFSTSLMMGILSSLTLGEDENVQCLMVFRKLPQQASWKDKALTSGSWKKIQWILSLFRVFYLFRIINLLENLFPEQKIIAQISIFISYLPYLNKI